MRMRRSGRTQEVFTIQKLHAIGSGEKTGRQTVKQTGTEKDGKGEENGKKQDANEMGMGKGEHRKIN